MPVQHQISEGTEKANVDDTEQSAASRTPPSTLASTSASPSTPGRSPSSRRIIASNSGSRRNIMVPPPHAYQRRPASPENEAQQLRPPATRRSRTLEDILRDGTEQFQVTFRSEQSLPSSEESSPDNMHSSMPNLFRSSSAVVSRRSLFANAGRHTSFSRLNYTSSQDGSEDMVLRPPSPTELRPTQSTVSVSMDNSSEFHYGTEEEYRQAHIGDLSERKTGRGQQRLAAAANITTASTTAICAGEADGKEPGVSSAKPRLMMAPSRPKTTSGKRGEDSHRRSTIMHWMEYVNNPLLAIAGSREDEEEDDTESDDDHESGMDKATEGTKSKQERPAEIHDNKCCDWRKVGLFVVILLIIAAFAIPPLIFILSTPGATRSKSQITSKPVEEPKDGGQNYTIPDFETQKRRDQLRELIIQNRVSKEEFFIFHDTNVIDYASLTPQIKALWWVADAKGLAAPDQDINSMDSQYASRILEYYALAVLFFSTNSRESVLQVGDTAIWRNPQGSTMVVAAVATNQYSATAVATTPYTAAAISMKTREVNENDQELKSSSVRHCYWKRCDGWLNDNTMNVCQWFGVGCNEVGTVTSLKLDNNRLHGPLPIRELLMTFSNSLMTLILSHNSLSGGLELERGADRVNNTSSWPHLEVLKLDDNFLTGPIGADSFSSSVLRVLDLSFNQFSGDFPIDPSKSPHLGILNIQGNQFDGPLPASIANLPTLEVLSLGSNAFTGTLLGFENLKNLKMLALDHNSFSGGLPTYLSLSVTSLQLHNNFFVGRIPESIGGFTNLETLAVDNNKLTGEIPASLADLTRLKSMLLFHNRLLGELPQIICDKKRGWLHNKKTLPYIAVDCNEKVQCDCCDKCY